MTMASPIPAVREVQVLSDDDLIKGLRADLAHVHPSADVLERLRFAARHGSRHPGRRRRLRWLRPSLAVPAFGGLATLVVVAFFAVSLHPHSLPGTGGGGHGTGGSAPPPSASGPPTPLHLSRRERKVIDYLMKANGAVGRADPDCSPPPRIPGPGAPPSLSNGTPTAGLLSILGALRRPRVASDRLPPRELWHGPHSKPHFYPYGTYPPAQGIYAQYIRKARSRYGAGYWLVPAANVNDQRPLPERCYQEQRAALRRELPSIPADWRSTALALQPRYLEYQKQLTLPDAGVCLVAINGTGNGDGSSCGYSAGEIESGHTLTSGAPTGVPVVYGLAPDGVATVTFLYTQHSHKRTLTVPVVNNVFILHNPRQRLPDDGFPSGLIWRSSSSRILKVVRLR